MREERFWSGYLKLALNSPPYYLARKVQDHFHRGLPDVLFIMRGKMGMLELKRIPKRPVRSTSMIPLGFTTDQKRWLVSGRRAGGSFWGLALVEETWYLLDPLAMERCAWIIRDHDLDDGCPAIVLTGHQKGLDVLREWLLRWKPEEALRTLVS